MKVGPAVGIIVLILITIIFFIFVLYILDTPDDSGLFFDGPFAAIGVEKDDIEGDYNITIVRINSKVPLNAVAFKIYYDGGEIPVGGVGVKNDSSSSSVRFGLIADIGPENSRENITFYDLDQNNYLSPGDFFILESDWDGKFVDGNNDGNFTNDGPVVDGQEFELIHFSNYTMSEIIIKT